MTTAVIESSDLATALSLPGVGLGSAWQTSKLKNVKRTITAAPDKQKLAEHLAKKSEGKSPNFFNKLRGDAWNFFKNRAIFGLGGGFGRLFLGIFSEKELGGNVTGFLKKKSGEVFTGFLEKPLQNTAELLIGGLGVASLAFQVGDGDLIQGSLNLAETVYEFDFNISDKQLNEQIKSAIDALYGNTGEFLGRSIAGLTIGSIFSPPKVEINVRTLAIQWRLAPELINEILQNVSNFAQIGLNAFRTITIKRMLIQGRKGIKALYKNASSAQKKFIESQFPGISKNIEKWGKGGESWSIEQSVNKKVEKIEDKRVQAFVREFISGFWQGVGDGVTMRYT
ncbi:hypothetical protein [Okeania sp. SIO2B3]|uniref:hypothetical protein n=1 Tax=Okeania sp. SIO2B3 TaxID=2607784 RepID=UPI0013C0F618|nr:hypothetical protein [Okeania sp. SIO2B3]NET40576.1 hypothetical protein [Okeania sp. SIO2B3]